MYGYDVRGEVFGSAGMLTMGDIRRTHLTAYGTEGVAAECVAYDQDLFHDAYVAGLADFTDSVRTGRTPSVTGEDARAALSIALAAIQSVGTGVPSASTSSRTRSNREGTDSVIPAPGSSPPTAAEPSRPTPPHGAPPRPHLDRKRQVHPRLSREVLKLPTACNRS
ncbi:hypothetical protein ABT186_22645 [Streptomyces sp. NPDC001634]|uniref:hypothetical protein n=1 Tax=Streptomyces sp. NPDC001634 TaxID=3154390 RepID=UPI0033172658